MSRPKHIKETHLQWLIAAILEPTQEACILWPFCMVDDDHALVRVGKKKHLAHRLAFRLYYGHFPMPLGLRSCGCQRCINPLHIFEGNNEDDGRLRSVQGRTNRKMKTAINLYEWIRQQIETRTDIAACWEWPHSKDDARYGRLGRPGDSTSNVLAHRAAFEILHGHEPMPKGRHTCDHAWCFNPHHVIEGTQAQNIADMMERGHHVAKKGTEHGGAKFTDEEIREIRALYTTGVYQIHLAKKFNVHQTCISRIVLRQTWAHIE